MTANVVTTQQTTAPTGTTTRRNRTQAQWLRWADAPRRPPRSYSPYLKGKCNTSLCGGSYGGADGRLAARLIEMNIILALATDPVARTVGRTVSGDTAFVLARDPDTVRIPDVAFVRHERLPPPLVSGRAALPPDLAVEIRSPMIAPASCGRSSLTTLQRACNRVAR